jgi:hypothetical protein
MTTITKKNHANGAKRSEVIIGAKGTTTRPKTRAADEARRRKRRNDESAKRVRMMTNLPKFDEALLPARRLRCTLKNRKKMSPKNRLARSSWNS